MVVTINRELKEELEHRLQTHLLSTVQSWHGAYLSGIPFKFEVNGHRYTWVQEYAKGYAGKMRRTYASEIRVDGKLSNIRVIKNIIPMIAVDVKDAMLISAKLK